jgi:hypoxia up-regulated 1
MKCIALAALAMVLGAAVVQSKVLGVDIGSENIKVTLVQPGRVPISIVTNEMSRRKSPGAVAFHQVRP